MRPTRARDLNGVIPRVVLPKGYETGAPRRCFAPIRPRRSAAGNNPDAFPTDRAKCRRTI